MNSIKLGTYIVVKLYTLQDHVMYVCLEKKIGIWTSINYISFEIEHKFDVSIQKGLLNIINYLIGYEGHEGQMKQDWKVFQTNRYKKNITNGNFVTFSANYYHYYRMYLLIQRKSLWCNLQGQKSAQRPYDVQNCNLQ